MDKYGIRVAIAATIEEKRETAIQQSLSHSKFSRKFRIVMAQMASAVVMPPIVEYLPDLSKHHIVGLFCFYAVTQCASRYVLPVFTKSNNGDSGSFSSVAPCAAWCVIRDTVKAYRTPRASVNITHSPASS